MPLSNRTHGQISMWCSFDPMWHDMSAWCAGAGVGKGRTIAGLILENWRCGRHRHLWISIGADLKVDARRDMDDVGANDIEVHALNKLQYGRLDSSKVRQLGFSCRPEFWSTCMEGQGAINFMR